MGRPAQRRCILLGLPTGLPARWPPFCPAPGSSTRARTHGPLPGAPRSTPPASEVPVASQLSLAGLARRVLSDSPGDRFFFSCGSCSVSPPRPPPLSSSSRDGLCRAPVQGECGLAAASAEATPQGQAPLSCRLLCPSTEHGPSRLLQRVSTAWRDAREHQVWPESWLCPHPSGRQDKLRGDAVERGVGPPPELESVAERGLPERVPRGKVLEETCRGRALDPVSPPLPTWLFIV